MVGDLKSQALEILCVVFGSIKNSSNVRTDTTYIQKVDLFFGANYITIQRKHV